MTELNERCRLAVVAVLLEITASLAGIGCNGSAAANVDPELARETLQNVLDSWKTGLPPTIWRDKSPKVVVQDSDWSSGRTLAEFELVGDGEPRDANLYCKVKLTFADDQAGIREKTVTYVVGTDPVLTVFRDMTN